MGDVDGCSLVLREEELFDHHEVGRRLIEVRREVAFDFEQAVLKEQTCLRFDCQPFDRRGRVSRGGVNEANADRG